MSGLGPLTIETNTRHSRLIATSGNADIEDGLKTAPPFLTTAEEANEHQQLETISDVSGWNASNNTDSEFSPKTLDQSMPAMKAERNSGTTDGGSSDHTHIDTLSPRTRATLKGTGVLRQTQSQVNLRSGAKLGNSSEPDLNSPTALPTLYSSASSQNLRSSKFPPRTPITSHMGLQTGGLPTGGFHLFDTRIHSPSRARSSDVDSSHPAPLESMPTEHLSKPFWLMRCLNHAISDPHGGYLSKKLFVPREIWLMKGVKLKGVDEKIAASDSLTTALQKLATVDRSDAESLLKEMQDLELVMTRAEVTLSKKLGSDVGPAGAAAMFKGADMDGDTMGNGMDGYQHSSAMKSSSSSGGSRNYLSWKKLRSKNTTSIIGNSNNNSYSAFPPSARSLESYAESTFSSGGGGVGYSNGVDHDSADGSMGSFSGPFAGYMHALSKLFEAAQVLGMPKSHTLHCIQN